MPRGRWPARLAAATVVSLALLAPAALLSSPTARAAGGGPSDFQIMTAAAAAQLSATQNPPNFGPFANGIVDATLGYATGDFATGGDSSAGAAAFYPGNLVAQGPSLFCQEVIPDIPGASCPGQLANFSYPLLAQASYPTAPRGSAGAGTGPVGGKGLPAAATPAPASATASASGNSSDTSLARGLFFTTTPAAVSVGSASSTETSAATSESAAVTVTTTLKNVTIGGLLRIATLKTADSVVVNASGAVTDQPRTTLAGVTLAGQPASIDESGVHAAGRSGALLVRQLSAKGLTVSLVGTSRQDAAAAARSTATGVLVSFNLPLATGQAPPQLPGPVTSACGQLGFPCGIPDPNATYAGQLVLGAVGVAVGAEPAINLNLNLNLALPPTGLPGAGASTAGAAPAVAPGTVAAAPPAGAAPRVAATPAARGFAGTLDSLAGAMIDRVYIALALGAAAVFLLWRAAATLAARRAR